MIEIRPGDKVLVLGQNGSGKSVWATSIARSWAQGSVVIFDPKGDDAEAVIPNLATAYRAADVVRHLPGRVLYRPTLAEYSRRPGDPSNRPAIWSRWDEIMRKLYELARRGQRPALVIVHELATLSTATAIGPAFGQAIREGRSKGITLILITQRPQGTSMLARSEAQHVVVYTLTDQAARDVAAELVADVDDPELAEFVRRRALPLDHRWWYRGRDLHLRLHDPLPYPGPPRQE